MPRDGRGFPDNFESDDSASMSGSSPSEENGEDDNGTMQSTQDSEAAPDGSITSPIEGMRTLDWKGIDDELAEFLADGSGDESDADSTSSQVSTASNRGNKHSLDDTTDDEGSDREESHIAKKKRLALNRSTGLKTVKTPGSIITDGGSSPPSTSAGEDGEEVDMAATATSTQESGENYGEDGLDDDDLEAEMMAEFEKEDAEEEAEANGEES